MRGGNAHHASKGGLEGMCGQAMLSNVPVPLSLYTVTLSKAIASSGPSLKWANDGNCVIMDVVC